MILFLEPVFVDRIWGGNKLKQMYNYSTSNTCGEVWGISAHKSGESIVQNGKFKGFTLSKLFSEHKELFGNYKGQEFPILVKLIDAKQDLSIQVHPNDEQAKKYSSLGKSECWYILDAKKDTSVIIGHKAKTKEELRKLINEKNYAKLLNKFSIKKGDYFYIEAGTIHAICKDTVLLEVQQSSDITFRVYDYDRLGLGNKLRPLHIDESLSCINIPNGILETRHNNKYFDFEVLNITTESNLKASNHGDYLVVLKGQGTINEFKCKQGDFIMVSSKDEYCLSGNLEIQRTRF